MINHSCDYKVAWNNYCSIVIVNPSAIVMTIEFASDVFNLDFFKVKLGAKVITIEWPVNALSIEKVVKPFQHSVQQSLLKEVQRLGINSFVQAKSAATVRTIKPAKM